MKNQNVNNRVKISKKKDKWNFTKEFGKVRKFYRIISAMFQNFHFLVKWFLKRHDTLASDRNINPESWNQPLRIWRNSFRQAFEVWVKRYMYNPREAAKKNGRYKDADDCYEFYYHQLNQKSFRFLIDFITTMCVEDTIYRELFTMWAYEMQFQMNAQYNPDQPNVHVMYCNYFRDDLQYFQIKDEVSKLTRAQVTGGSKIKKPSRKYHQAISNARQAVYASDRVQVDIDKARAKIVQLEQYKRALDEQSRLFKQKYETPKKNETEKTK